MKVYMIVHCHFDLTQDIMDGDLTVSEYMYLYTTLQPGMTKKVLFLLRLFI